VDSYREAVNLQGRRHIMSPRTQLVIIIIIIIIISKNTKININILKSMKLKIMQPTVQFCNIFVSSCAMEEDYC